MALDFEHSIGLNPIKGGALFHPNGQHYLSAAGGNVVISNLVDSNKQEFLRGHDDNITALAVSKNGTFVASGQGGTDPNVIVWDFESRKILYTIEEHDYAIQSLAFSDDEKVLATLGSSEDHKMVLWDMSTGAIIAFTNKVPLGSLCVSFGGYVRDIKRRDTNNYLLCSGGKEGMMMWDLDPYQGELMPFRLAGDARATMVRIVTDVCFSVDKEYVYASTTTGDFLIASMKHNRIIQTVQATKLGLDAIVAAPVGIVVGCGDKTVKIFDNTFEFQGEIVFDGIVDGLSMSPDSQEILVTTRHGSVFRANVASRDHIIISEAHTAGITAVAYEMGSNDRFATASLDGTIKLWDNQDYVVSATCHPRRDQERGVIPLCIAYSDIIISGWSDGKVCAYDDVGNPLWMIDNAHPGGVMSLVLSHNKRFILTGGPAGEVRLWELRTRDLISHLKEHVGKVTSIALSKDDTFCVTASRDRCILRWDLRSEKRVHCHMQRMGGINNICLSGDEQYIVSVGQDKKITFWGLESTDASHSQSLSSSRDDVDEGQVVVLSQDGKFIATGGTAGLVRLWEYESSQLIAEAAGHSGTITSIAFSADGKQITSVGSDGSIFMWMLIRNQS